MRLRSLIVLVSVLSAFAFGACSKPAQKVAPETRGKRGENCQARNDCETGLACLNGICAKNEFAIDVTAKHCDRIECSVDKDCCGDRLTMAPAKCKGRENICDPANATVPGCVQTSCVSNTTCNGGVCGLGTCQGSGQSSFDMCTTAADCPANTCVIPLGETIGSCSLTFATCTADNEAITCLQGTCANRRCDCTNAEYDPTAPICSDEECENVCLLRCDQELCVEDQSCKTDAECLQIGLTTCDGGRCVECTQDDDCDEDADETCEQGLCHKPCKANEECGLFEECNAGDCEYVGCRSDRECILAASRGDVVPDGEIAAAVTNGADDPRLYKCLASELDASIKTCKIPCENDGSCGQFQVCDKGYCKFVGCEDDTECRAYLNIANQMTSETKPYVATAVCRE